MSSERNAISAQVYVGASVEQLHQSLNFNTLVQTLADEMSSGTYNNSVLIEELFLLSRGGDELRTDRRDSAFGLLVQFALRAMLSNSDTYRLVEHSCDVCPTAVGLFSKRILMTLCWRRYHFELASMVLEDLLICSQLHKENYLNALWHANVCVFNIYCDLDDSAKSQAIALNLIDIAAVLDCKIKIYQAQLNYNLSLMMSGGSSDIAHGFSNLVELLDKGQLELEQNNVESLLVYAVRSQTLIGESRESERLLHRTREQTLTFSSSTLQMYLLEESRYFLLKEREMSALDRANEFVHLQSTHPDSLARYLFGEIKASLNRRLLDVDSVKLPKPLEKVELANLFYRAVQKKFSSVFEAKWSSHKTPNIRRCG